LAGALAPAEARAAREHVSRCERCQAALDRLSDHPELQQWTAACGRLPPTGAAEPAPARLLERLRETLPWHTRVPGTAPAPRDPPIDFLAGPAQAGDLGTFGPYRVLAELGRGGMGIVLRAYDPELERPVALKVLRPECADAAARARFVREARAAAAIAHEHVVAVHAVANPDDAPPSLATHYLPGPPLP